MEEEPDVSYLFLIQNGIPAIINNAAAPLALVIKLSIISHAGGQNYIAAWSIVQSTISFIQGIFNFLLYVPMAHISHLVGQQSTQVETQTQISWALSISVGVGFICIGSLYVGFQGIVLSIMKVVPDIQPLIMMYFMGLIPSILFAFVSKVCTGIMVGKQHIQMVTLLNAMMNIFDVAFNFVVLLLWKGNLFQAGVATSIATFIGVILLVPSAIFMKPKMTNTSKQINSDALDSFDAWKFIQSSSNMMIRSISLQSAMYSSTIAASRLGPSPLAAHQVIIQLWSLVSYACDGFADVGTMIGGRLIGSQKHSSMILLTKRLFILAFIMGIFCTALLIFYQNSIIDFFITDTNNEIKIQLSHVWLLTMIMQPINAIVYISDGILYAHQAFAYVRNLMLLGVFIIFGPILIIGYTWTHTLLSIWIAKSILSLWRSFAAFWFSYQYTILHSSPKYTPKSISINESTSLLT